MQEPKTDRRIVSKGAYAKVQMKRTLLFVTGSSMVFFAIAGIQTDVFRRAARWMCLEVFSSRLSEGFILSALSTSFFLIFAAWGKKNLDRAMKIISGVPLTRANTADLPAPDSLVRASEKPASAQETVLLRVAAYTSERREEQLLRAAGKQK